MPHISYDLDGDGIVGQNDYFLAKRFDLDQDGQLNATEKQNALKALESGYENQFQWKVDQTGVNRGKRILQIRGKIIDAEDFLPITSTYPTHPLTQLAVTTTTASQLKANRKAEMMSTYRKTKEEWDKLNPTTQPQKYILSEYLVDKPQ